jgi:hypothetical protein
MLFKRAASMFLAMPSNTAWAMVDERKEEKEEMAGCARFDGVNVRA